MPDFIREFRQLNPLQFILAGLVEETQFDFRRMRAKQRKVHASPVPRRTSRIWRTLANLPFFRNRKVFQGGTRKFYNRCFDFYLSLRSREKCRIVVLQRNAASM